MSNEANLHQMKSNQIHFTPFHPSPRQIQAISFASSGTRSAMSAQQAQNRKDLENEARPTEWEKLGIFLSLQ
jgi:hypothetical protein